jgi:hypothetical protein
MVNEKYKPQLEYYYRNKKNISLKNKERYNLNKDKYLKRKKEYVLKNKEKIKQKDKEYRLKNLNVLREKARDNYYKNRKKRLDYSKKYKKANWLKILARHKEDDYLIKERVRRKTRCLGIIKLCCVNCGGNEKLEFHHITYEPNNYIVLCKKCHSVEHRKNEGGVFN